jgi:hypothetical protein
MNTPPVDLILERATRAATSPATAVVAELVKIAQGYRAPLEAASTVLVGRLHQRPDDFDATGALLLVIRALQHVGHTLPVGAEAPGRHRKKPKGTQASSS